MVNKDPDAFVRGLAIPIGRPVREARTVIPDVCEVRKLHVGGARTSTLIEPKWLQLASWQDASGPHAMLAHVSEAHGRDLVAVGVVCPARVAESRPARSFVRVAWKLQLFEQKRERIGEAALLIWVGE